MKEKQSQKPEWNGGFGFGFSILHQLSGVVFLFIFSLAFLPVSQNLSLMEAASSRVLSAEVIEARGQQVFMSKVLPPRQIAPLVLDGVNAKSFVVYDELSGEVLISRNTATAYPIASLTKLLTALVSYKYLNLEKVIPILPEDQSTIRPVLGLQAGDQVLPVHLIQSMLVGSANDAALTLAHAVEKETGKSFTYLMNLEAAGLGMGQSNFSNAVGFDSDYNYATAEDVVKLIKATQALPVFTMESRSASYGFTSLNGRAFYIRATNKLITKHSDIAAIKTGYTGEARGAMAIKVENSGHPFVILALHSESREADVLTLKAIIEESYRWE